MPRNFPLPRFRSLVAGACALAFASAWPNHNAARADEIACGVASFTPGKETPLVRQAVAKFARNAVGFGDPRARDYPFQVTCAEKGQGRWLDTKTWVYDFARELPAGVSCTFTLKPDFTCVGGVKPASFPTFTVSTGGPTILETRPYRYGIAEDAAIALKLNGPADAASVERAAYFRVAGMAGKIPVTVIGGKAREDVLADIHRYAEKPSAEDLARFIVIQAKRPFPTDAKIELVWDRGIRSAGGVARGEAQILEFHVREPFRATVSCDREKADGPCIPIAAISLGFTAPVPRALVEKARVKAPDGQEWRPALANDSQEVYGLTFKGPFPPDSHLSVVIPPGLKDSFERPLVNAAKFPVSLKTGQAPALLKFPGTFGVLESEAGGVLPVTVRNVENILAGLAYAPYDHSGFAGKLGSFMDGVRVRFFRTSNVKGDEILAWLHRVERVKRERSVFQEWPKPDKEGEREDQAPVRLPPADALKAIKIPRTLGKKETEVLGLPLKDPGFYVVEVASPDLGRALLGKDAPMYVATTTLVTNMSVHVKQGHENSLVWVTSLDKAQPIPGALVSVVDCHGKSHFTGKTGDDGFALIDQRLPEGDAIPRCGEEWGTYQSGLLFVAEKGGDMSFTHSSWDKGIESWRFNVPTGLWQADWAVHAVFDRTLLKPGETIHFKAFVRRRVMRGFTFPDAASRPAKVTVTFPAMDLRWDVPLRWVNDGAAVGQWTVPKDAKAGHYQVMARLPKPGAATAKDDKEADKGGESEGDEAYAGAFRVDEFRIPLAKGAIVPPKESLVRPKTVGFDVSVQYLNGGGADELPIRFRARVTPGAHIAPKGFEDFTFGNGGVTPGLVREDEARERPVSKDVFNQEMALDDQGARHVAITLPPMGDKPVTLAAELEFRDPNGEIQTVSRDVPVWPAPFLVGIKAGEWAMGRDKVKVSAAVVDRDGRGLKGRRVTIRFHTRKTFSHRKKIIGSFYSFENRVEIGPAVEFCRGETDGKGIVTCEKPTTLEGEVVAVAEADGPNGGASAAQRSFWLRGESDWWFGQDDHDRMDLLPERPGYEPGESARLQVRMPFRAATALVAVEREGVIRAFVRKLSGKGPVVDVPLEEDDAPNVYVSVLAVRGREEGPKPTGMVDLAKPAFKLGIAPVKVGYARHALGVDVAVDKTSYHVREKGWATVKVSVPGGKPLPKGADVAIAIVDAGLLQIKPNESWRLLEAMMGERPYLVSNVTNQSEVIGKRHFGKKGTPDGGGGGSALTRTIFDPLVLWQGSVVLDDKGQARVPFTTNDSLTSFKVAAVASAGAKYFGTGLSELLTRQDVMVLPGIPPTGRHGETQTVGVTVRNATDRAMTLTATLSVPGAQVGQADQSLDLKPHGSASPTWTVTLPTAGDALTYRVGVSEKGQAVDRVEVTQTLSSPHPVTTIQATLMQLAAGTPQDLPVTPPEGRLPGRGGLDVRLSRSLLGNMDDVRTYMHRYPYTCFEQQASRAVALDDRKAWDALIARLRSYLDDAGFVKFFPSMDQGSPVLTTYVLRLAHESGWPLPETERDAMLQGLTRFVQGEVTRTDVYRMPDLVLKKLAALDAVSRFRAVDDGMTASIEESASTWPTSALIDWYGIHLRGKELSRRDAVLKRVRGLILSRLTFNGTRVGFSTEELDDLWWLWEAPTTNAMRLVLLSAEDPAFAEDAPKVMAGVVGRLRKDGTWGSTHDNAMGVLAVRSFSRRFEKDTVSGETTAALGGVTRSFAWDKGEGLLSLPFPDSPATLALRHEGTGAPWATVASRAAIPVTEARASGLQLARSVTPLRQKTPGSWHVGDVFDVTLTVTAPSDLAWVVVSDPVPSGASIIGGGLRPGPALESRDETARNDLWPSFQEDLATGHRSYFEYMPKGTWHVRYRFRVNNAGRFIMPPSHAEAMYAPEIFADVPVPAPEVLP